MRLQTLLPERKTRRWGSLVIIGFLVLHACSLDKVTVPDLFGPSELGTSVKLTASPDVLVADGTSSSTIQATVRDQNGKPAPGRGMFFRLADEQGQQTDIGTLSSTTAVTDANGIAQVIYYSPERTDFTANQSLIIQARPITDDLNGAVYRTVRIELRSAESRIFPPAAPTDLPPKCQFITEPAVGPFPAGSQVLFQSTSIPQAKGPNGTSSVIVRYQWYFGDGGTADKSDVNHVYSVAGNYTATHVVTDNFGLQSSCGRTMVVQ